MRVRRATVGLKMGGEGCIEPAASRRTQRASRPLPMDPSWDRGAPVDIPPRGRHGPANTLPAAAPATCAGQPHSARQLGRGAGQAGTRSADRGGGRGRPQANADNGWQRRLWCSQGPGGAGARRLGYSRAQRAGVRGGHGGTDPRHARLSLCGQSPTRHSFSLKQGLQCVFPPGGGSGAVSVPARDLVWLDPGNFLNDTIIDFYLRCGWGLVEERAGVAPALARCHGRPVSPLPPPPPPPSSGSRSWGPPAPLAGTSRRSWIQRSPSAAIFSALFSIPASRRSEVGWVAWRRRLCQRLGPGPCAPGCPGAVWACLGEALRGAPIDGHAPAPEPWRLC